MDEVLTTKQFYTLFNDFLIVFLHNLTYAANMYPRTIYRSVRQYGVATWRCEHPGVRKWAENSASQVVEALKHSESSRIVFALVKNNQVQGRYCFDTRHLPQINQEVPEANKSEAELQLKAALHNLLHTNPANEGIETIHIYIEDIDPFSEHFRDPKIQPFWMVGDEQHDSQPQTFNSVRPVRFLSMGSFSMSLWYENQ